MTDHFTHRHLKSGNLYREIARGYDCTNARSAHAVLFVVYQDATGETYVREAAEFDDGRFERLHGDG